MAAGAAQAREARPVAGALLLLDCASLLYRAYHAIPRVTTADGFPVNAVLGYLNYLSRLIPDRKPARMVSAMDADWRPEWRVAALPTYKTHRVAPKGQGPDDTEIQVPVLLEVLDAFGLSVVQAEGYEAEDVIATLAAREKGPVEIVTGDRDLFAIVRDPRVRVLYTLRGVSELASVDEAWIQKKYGIPGDRYLDYALLRGDPSDGLPGVAGIGEKTATALVARYGSLDAILAAKDLSPTIRLKLRASADYLAAARRVVPPVADCPVEGGDGTLPRVPVHPDALRRLAERYTLSESVGRLSEMLSTRD